MRGVLVKVRLAFTVSAVILGALTPAVLNAIGAEADGWRAFGSAEPPAVEAEALAAA